MTKVLVFTSLFPNKVKLDSGVFIKKRMLAYSKRKSCEIIVVAPLPYFPKITFLKKYAYFSQIAHREIIEGVSVYHPRYPLIPKISMPIHGQLMYHAVKGFIRKIYREFRFDIIDAHFIFPDCQAAVQLGEFFNVPVVSSARGSDINEFIYYPLIRPQIIRTLQKSAKIISVCQALKEMMVNMGIQKDKITVIPNGIDTDLFYPSDKNSAKKKFNLQLNKQMILSVGSLIPRKSHDLTIRAVSHLVNKGYNLQLCILGAGEEMRNLKKLINDLNLAGSVFLMGHVPNEELVQWYNASDLFVLASEREGWANVLTESLTCGTPVVATNVFGASEIVKDDSMGFLVNRSVEAIAEGIEKALNTKWEQNKISKKICERTWDVVAREVEEVFDLALKNFKTGKQV